MLNWSHIIEGWRNHLIPPAELKDFILQTSEDRKSVCRSCEYYSKSPYEHCTICGCPLKALTKCLSCNCSMEELEELPKWEAVVSYIQEEEFNMEDDEEEKEDSD